ncbi:MAG: Rieske (2Fe-2S) protein [bacterium]
MMGEMIRVCELEELKTRHAMRVTVNNEEVALFYIERELHTVQNDCPHQHVQAIVQGILNGYEITCPMHGWTYDLKSGKALIGAGNLQRYNVSINKGAVWIEDPEEQTSW